MALWAAAYAHGAFAGTGAAAPGTDWPLLGNNAEMQHYSPLAEINDKTVAKLGLAWSADIPSLDGLVGNPLVAGGAVYQSGPQGRVYANDLRTGRLMWRFDAKTDFDGVALPKQPVELVKQGELLYGEHNCAGCHGAEAENASGVAKDLRFASAETHRDFSAIVIGGTRHDRGMPAFSDLTPDEARAIQGYVVNQAWTAYEAQRATPAPPSK
jgi:mono/diheme cytochrome c family protein